MRLRTSLVSVLVATMTLVGGTALAHDDEGHDSKHDTPEDPKADWEAQQPANAPGVNSSAPSWSDRPDRFAPCVRGVAYLPEFDDHPVLGSGAFPCNRVDLLSYLPPTELLGGFATGTGRGSDVWGWTDPETGVEYVLAGNENGTAIIDISDPKRPIFLAHLPTASAQNLIWRDIKVYADHAFVVAESGGHGMQVLDLNRLRDLDAADAPVILDADVRYTGFLRAHNIAINEDTGFAYAVGQRDDAEGCISSMHIMDIRDPKNPTFVGCFDADNYVHDAHCVVYDGPDTRFSGREICVNSSPNPGTTGNTVAVADVTDKDEMVMLANVGYPNSGYSHQGWFLDGHRYYLHTSEVGGNRPGGQGVDIFDLADLTNPQHIGFFQSPAQSTHHNLYQKNRYVYQSNYSSGLRIYDTRNVAAGGLSEVAYFDVYPPNDNQGFGFGTWSNYPWFDSGVVAVHGYQGLFLVKPRVGEREP